MPVDSKRILCVDSDEKTCELLTHTLGLEEIQSKTAHSLGEALRFATAERFDLFIIENEFADGTGLALCRLLRSYQPEAIVIFFVDEDHVLTREEALEAGADEIIIKTGDFAPLLQTLCRYI
jgi:DNA-binding response OmpR family regulator